MFIQVTQLKVDFLSDMHYFLVCMYHISTVAGYIVRGEIQLGEIL